MKIFVFIYLKMGRRDDGLNTVLKTKLPFGSFAHLSKMLSNCWSIEPKAEFAVSESESIFHIQGQDKYNLVVTFANIPREFDEQSFEVELGKLEPTILMTPSQNYTTSLKVDVHVSGEAHYSFPELEQLKHFSTSLTASAVNANVKYSFDVQTDDSDPLKKSGRFTMTDPQAYLAMENGGGLASYQFKYKIVDELGYSTDGITAVELRFDGTCPTGSHANRNGSAECVKDTDFKVVCRTYDLDYGPSRNAVMCDRQVSCDHGEWWWGKFNYCPTGSGSEVVEWGEGAGSGIKTRAEAIASFSAYEVSYTTYEGDTIIDTCRCE